MLHHCLRSVVLLVALLLAAGPIAGCGDSQETVQIDDVREVPRGRAALPPEVGAAERFGLGGRARPHGQPPKAPPLKWSWTTPEGWEELSAPGGGMRVAGFRVAGNDDAECTVVVLEGTGGGLAANVNRWRRQMGLEALDGEAVSALPRRPLVGEEAVFVDLEGTYGGMGGGAALENARMVGLVLGLGAKTLFVKLVGPSAVIAAEQERFDAFARSLQVQTGTSPPLRSEPPARGSRLSWTLPDGWRALPGERMREASFVPAGARNTECYIIILKGRAGGIVANVNLWRQQMGQPPLKEDEVASLERVPMLGVEGVQVEVEGSFKGKVGEELADAVLLGAIIERAADTVFVKMVGPRSEVGPEKGNFAALCRSLEE